MSNLIILAYGIASIALPNFTKNIHPKWNLIANINALCVIMISLLFSLFSISQWVNTHIHNNILWVIAIGFTWVSFFLLLDVLISKNHHHLIGSQLTNHPLLKKVLTGIGISYIGLIIISIIGM